jgi:hypothetical protein
MGSTNPNDNDLGSQIPRLIDHGLHRRLTVRSVKLFADGALGSWGAALKAPYTDKPEMRGFLLAPPKTLHEQAEKCYEDGFQVVRKIISRFDAYCNVIHRTFTLSVTTRMRLCLTSSRIFSESQAQT